MTIVASKDLETFPAPSDSFVVRFDCPEFTALCPKTGQPDFANIRVWYKPHELCIELKSLKGYLWSFRDEGHFHEKVTSMIRDDLDAAIKPLWLLVEGDFWVRGGIHTVIWAAAGKEARGGYHKPPEALVVARQNHFAYRSHG